MCYTYLDNESTNVKQSHGLSKLCATRETPKTEY